MLALEDVKKYLRVDYEEDNEFIDNLIYTAEAYLYDFTERVLENSDLFMDLFVELNYDVATYSKSDSKKAETYMLAMISELYDKRELSAEKATKTHLIYKSLLNSIRSEW